MQDVLNEALSLAAQGISVFPCRPADEKVGALTKKAKSPYTATGFKAASTDLNVINRWWKTWPNAMIGVPTGRASGFTVLDLDIDAETELNGFEVMKQFPPLPQTRTVKTPCGGSHYYFIHQDGLVNSVSRIGPGVDVRSDGGYVIVPPSRLLDGRQYVYEGGQ